MIKEFCKASNTAIIRENSYGSKLSKFTKLFAEAKKDFPYLEEEDIEIVKYGGERYAKTFGIEFYATTVPEEYARISQLEYTS